MTGQPGSAISLALLSSSETQLLTDAIRSEMRTWGWDLRIWHSGFNQYRQDIANPQSFLYLDQPQIVLLHLDGEDLFADCLRDPFAYAAPARLQRAKDAAHEVEHYVVTLRKRLPETLVILNTVYLPPVHSLTGLEHHSAWGLADLAAHYNEELARIARHSSNILVNDVASLAFKMGYENWFDPRLWYLARCRLSGEAMKALARQTGSLLRGWKGLSRKCLVLDLDNTLWGGFVGEDGIAGIVLGEEGLGMAFVEFQQELLSLSRKGVLLAICSKNNEEDVLEVLRQHPSMLLRDGAFAAKRINWRDKATNLHELAEELNIGLDTLVFIDDNPVERCLVKASLPEVHVPDWPREPACFKAALFELASQHFPRVALTTEDGARTALYRADAGRRNSAVSTGSLEDYYRSLEMRAEIGYGDQLSIPRIAQLTQKTNQFNLANRRYTETEIRMLAEAPDSLVMWLRLRDRFSDDGIVGVLILRQRDTQSWMIDTFLMSCRVIGRTVENAFLGCVCQVMKRHGACEVIGEYVPTKKNNVVVNFYRDLGFEPIESHQGTTHWRLPLNEKPIPIPEWIAIDVAEETAHA
jgi:FkbH-like protein